jgi:hypothetical protein
MYAYECSASTIPSQNAAPCSYRGQDRKLYTGRKYGDSNCSVQLSLDAEQTQVSPIAKAAH